MENVIKIPSDAMPFNIAFLLRGMLESVEEDETSGYA